jgi:hypothetical protein
VRGGLLCLGVLLLAGCGGPTFTIRELGQPAFERYVGAETRFERVDERELQGLNAFPDTSDSGADHRFGITFLPTGDAERVWLGIEVQPRGKLGIKQLVAAVYLVDATVAANFPTRGKLPPDAVPLMVADKVIRGGKAMALKIMIPRKDLAGDKRYLAIPALTQFEDGWIYVRFLKTSIPTAAVDLRPPPAKKKPGKADSKPAKESE